jgi:nucleoside-diphosphate-sugar epimerase
MSTSKKRVFLTGATGNMGREVLRELVDRADRFEVVALVLPTARDREAIAEFRDARSLSIVYGDLTEYDDVERCVRGADFVLHTGALVSPAADDHPELTMKVNVGGARNIIRAVKAQDDPDSVGVVMIGSVAETGDRNPPHHWGRVGDPLKPAMYDTYAQSKIIAERELVDSGLRKWAWLRQTGIFHPGLLEIRDPILTHWPFGGAMEWVSAGDSGRLLANACEDDVPDEFWGGVYNVGGGPTWRLTNWELQTRMMSALGVADVRRWYERNWFATQNFHGHWYTDSDRLDDLLHFRTETFEEALTRAVASAPASVRLAGHVPPRLVKRFVIKPLTIKPRGTMSWIDSCDEERIRAYFGSRAQWEQIGNWSTFEPPDPTRRPTYLDLGFDETRDPSTWTAGDLVRAADFRGGALLSETVTTADVAAALRWQCAEGHTFTASPRLVLTAGHWCPTCVSQPRDYARQAESNAFLRQVV